MAPSLPPLDYAPGPFLPSSDEEPRNRRPRTSRDTDDSSASDSSDDESRDDRRGHHRSPSKSNSVFDARTGRYAKVSKHAAAQRVFSQNQLFLHVQSSDPGPTSGIEPTCIDPVRATKFLTNKALDIFGPVHGHLLGSLAFFHGLTEDRALRFLNFVFVRPRVQDSTDLCYRDFAHPSVARLPVSFDGMASGWR